MLCWRRKEGIPVVTGDELHALVEEEGIPVVTGDKLHALLEEGRNTCSYR